LREARRHEQQRGEHADRPIGRQQAHREGRERHQEDDRAQRPLAAVAIAVLPKNDGADRAHHEAHAEDGEGQQEGDDRGPGRKEQLRDDRDEIAVDREVVPFKDIADHSRNDCGPSAIGRLADGKVSG